MDSVLVPIVLSAMIGLMAWAARAAMRARDRRLLAAEGGFEALFAGLGLEVEAPGEDAYDSVKAVGMGGAFVLELDCSAVEVLGSSSVLSVELALGASFPEGFVSRGHRWARTEKGRMCEGIPVQDFLDVGGVGELFEFEGDERAVLAVCGSSLPRTLYALYDVPEESPVHVQIEGGVLTWRCQSPFFLLGSSRHMTLSRLFEGFGAFADAVEAREGEAAELIYVVRNRSVLPTTRRGGAGGTYRDSLRWAAARELCAHHASSEEVRAFEGTFEVLDPLARAACLRWGGAPGGAFACRPNERVDALRVVASHPDVRDDVRGVLTGELAWHTLLDFEAPVSLRMEAASRAWGAPDMPTESGEREKLLVELFTESYLNEGLALPAVFEALVEAGWDPSVELVARIAREGEREVRVALVDHIRARPDRREYATVLAFLKQERVLGAAALFDELDLSKVGGSLSLAAEDTSRGGLTQAGERGGLSAPEE